MAKRYRKSLWEADRVKHDSFLVSVEKEKQFIFWQKGGGFDRNLWNAKAIHDSIRYIEANPIRSRLVGVAEAWPWSSAFARAHKKGVIADTCNIPVEMPNPQAQSIGVVWTVLLHNPDTVKGDRGTRIEEGIWSHKWHGHPPVE
jgi:hypothetical protein